jgi:hypothetical protein
VGFSKSRPKAAAMPEAVSCRRSDDGPERDIVVAFGAHGPTVEVGPTVEALNDKFGAEESFAVAGSVPAQWSVWSYFCHFCNSQ